MKFVALFFLALTVSLTTFAATGAKLYQGVFVIDDAYLYCELLELTSNAKSCNYKTGQSVPFAITMTGQTSNIVIDGKKANPVKFDTLLTNFSGQQAHYNPVNETILVLDGKETHIVRMYRSKNKRYRAAGHFKLIDRQTL